MESQRSLLPGKKTEGRIGDFPTDSEIPGPSTGLEPTYPGEWGGRWLRPPPGLPTRRLIKINREEWSKWKESG